MADSATPTAKTVNIALPKPGQTLNVYAEPHEHITIAGVDFSKIKIDIVGSDIILTDPATKAQIYFVGLALLMFDPSEAPVLDFDGTTFDSQALLGKIGEIGNLTMQDFVAISSITPDQHDKDKNDAAADKAAAQAAEAKADAA